MIEAVVGQTGLADLLDRLRRGLAPATATVSVDRATDRRRGSGGGDLLDVIATPRTTNRHPAHHESPPRAPPIAPPRAPPSDSIVGTPWCPTPTASPNGAKAAPGTAPPATQRASGPGRVPGGRACVPTARLGARLLALLPPRRHRYPGLARVVTTRVRRTDARHERTARQARHERTEVHNGGASRRQARATPAHLAWRVAANHHSGRRWFVAPGATRLGRAGVRPHRCPNPVRGRPVGAPARGVRSPGTSQQRHCRRIVVGRAHLHAAEPDPPTRSHRLQWNLQVVRGTGRYAGRRRVAGRRPG